MNGIHFPCEVVIVIAAILAHAQRHVRVACRRQRGRHCAGGIAVDIVDTRASALSKGDVSAYTSID